METGSQQYLATPSPSVLLACPSSAVCIVIVYYGRDCLQMYSMYGWVSYQLVCFVEVMKVSDPLKMSTPKNAVVPEQRTSTGIGNDANVAAV